MKFGTDNLQRYFSEEEIKIAVFSMNHDYVPDLDGFSVLLCQEFWYDIKNELMDIFSEFFYGYLDINKFYYAHVILLPKKGANSIYDFRPINLLNVICRIITKVLTNRLYLLLKDLISKTQFGFTVGKFVLDCIAAAQKLMLTWVR